MILLSVFKPIVMTAGLLAWARIVGFYHQDLKAIPGSKRLWDVVQIATGVVAFTLWLCIPDYWLGMLVAILVVGLASGFYVYYRNQRVPIEARWSLRHFFAVDHPDSPPKAWTHHHVAIQLVDPKGHVLDKPTSRRDPDTWINHLFEQLIGYAVTRGAQRVRIKTNAQEAAVLLEIDGIGYIQPTIQPATAVRLIDYLKLRVGMDLSERRRRLTGNLWVRVGEADPISLILTTAGSMRGLELDIDINTKTTKGCSLSELGMSLHQEQQITPALDQANGLVLVACPPSHGQTSLLYSLIRRHDPYIENIVTLEDQITLEIEGVNHQQSLPGSGPHDARQLKSLLRQSPQVLMVSHVPDARTAKLLAKSARGIRIYAGMRQMDTFAALQKWISNVGDPQAAAETLRVIVAGHLLRKLCTTCRVPYTPHPEFIKKLNLLSGHVSHLYKQSGVQSTAKRTRTCPDCSGLGYKGRLGVFEVMTLDNEARSLIANHQLDALRVHLRKNKMVWLQEVAVACAIEGITTIGEITRVLNQDNHPTRPPHSEPKAPE